MLLGRPGKSLYSQLWVAKKNFSVGGKRALVIRDFPDGVEIIGE